MLPSVAALGMVTVTVERRAGANIHCAEVRLRTGRVAAIASHAAAAAIGRKNLRAQKIV